MVPGKIMKTKWQCWLQQNVVTNIHQLKSDSCSLKSHWKLKITKSILSSHIHKEQQICEYIETYY
uniref:Uncharacterized protein n=1 Tax=Arion vulgaris TaxID=1028688 RepID=A0A0B7AX24_9EUPU